jgi:hypothetical protein
MPEPTPEQRSDSPANESDGSTTVVVYHIQQEDTSDADNPVWINVEATDDESTAKAILGERRLQGVTQYRVEKQTAVVYTSLMDW